MKKKSHLEVVQLALEGLGWATDRWGHMQVVAPSGTVYRIKFQPISVRLEMQMSFGAGNEWVKIDGDYLKDVKILEDGKVQIGTHKLGKN